MTPWWIIWYADCNNPLFTCNLGLGDIENWNLEIILTKALRLLPILHLTVVNKVRHHSTHVSYISKSNNNWSAHAHFSNSKDLWLSVLFVSVNLVCTLNPIVVFGDMWQYSVIYCKCDIIGF